jgi:hypothetical protein
MSEKYGPIQSNRGLAFLRRRWMAHTDLAIALLYDNQRLGSIDVLYTNAARCTSMDRSESREKVMHSD